MGAAPPKNFPPPGVGNDAPTAGTTPEGSSSTQGAPPQNFPPPTAGVSAGIDFPKSPDASICGFSFALPRFSFGFNFNLPFAFPPKLPFPYFSFALSCDPTKPIDIQAGVKFGGGRSYNAEPSPDLMENSP